MSRDPDGRVESPWSHSKARDRALLLPLLGLVALLPPIAGIFQLDFTIAGIPFLVLYLFTVWALLIAGAALLSRRLHDDAQPGVEPDSAGDQSGQGDA